MGGVSLYFYARRSPVHLRTNLFCPQHSLSTSASSPSTFATRQDMNVSRVQVRQLVKIYLKPSSHLVANVVAKSFLML